MLDSPRLPARADNTHHYQEGSMAVLFKFDDPLAAIVEQIEYEGKYQATAKTRVAKRFHSGRVSGLREALEIVDIYLRCEKSGTAVAMRNANVIIAEVRAAA
jgi:hypothetical protein